MCGIAGLLAFDQNNERPERQTIAREMGETLNHRGPNGKGQWANSHGVLAHRRLAVMDPARGHQPMVRRRGRHEFAIAYNGELYNAKHLRRELGSKGWAFETDCDTEVLLLSYMEWGEACVHRLEGIYAFVIWDGIRERFFLCRDRFGVKPLFYAHASDGTLLFASEIKALFDYPGFRPRVGDDGWREVLGIGPARTAGFGVFANVSELKPGHCMRATRSGVRSWRYWQLDSRPHRENYEDSVHHTRELLTGAIRRQLASDVSLCTFLSGGLDSSIITAVAAREIAAQGRPSLETYSFDYADNARYFHPTAFQPDDDAPWAMRMAEAFHTRHRILTCPIAALCDALVPAMEAKDLPGMADVDSSLWWFCREVSQHHVVALSGECADEIFGGYPWFVRPEMLFADGFPWSMDLEVRRSTWNKEVWRRLAVGDYVHSRYAASVAETPRLEGEVGAAKRRREVTWLNLNWFMSTLLERKDRMSMASGLEVRVPFCDHHLVEYVWNIPWEMKARGGVRKQLLRDAARDILPEDVRSRPKRPYPKTYNPAYEALVKVRVEQLLAEKDAPIRAIIDEAALRERLLLSAGDCGKHWFGQLMAGPQMLAYLVQINAWMKKFGLEQPF